MDEVADTENKVARMDMTDHNHQLLLYLNLAIDTCNEVIKNPYKDLDKIIYHITRQWVTPTPRKFRWKD